MFVLSRVSLIVFLGSNEQAGRHLWQGEAGVSGGICEAFVRVGREGKGRGAGQGLAQGHCWLTTLHTDSLMLCKPVYCYYIVCSS